MIAIKYKEYEKYGCPNCGCDSISEHIKLPKDSSLVRCKNCNLNYFISSDKNPLNVEFEVDGKFEQPQLIVHPRKKSELEKWSKPNLYIRPSISKYYYINSEVCIPLTMTDDKELIAEVTSELAAKNIIDMIKSVLSVEDSYSNYSVKDYNKILVSFNQYEFDTIKLLEFLSCTHYITNELLIRTKKNDQVYLDQLLLVNRFSTLYLGVPYIPKSNIMKIGKSYYIHSMNEVIYIVDINEDEISYTKLPKMIDYDDICPTIINHIVPYFELSMKDVEIKPFEIDKYLRSKGTISVDENGDKINLSAAEILALLNNFYFNKNQMSSIDKNYLRELLDTSSYSRYILSVHSDNVFLTKLSE